MTPDGLLRLQGWARDGLTLEQIAHNCGVADSTFRVWKDKYPAIAAALKKGQGPVDYEVENALYKSAMGYTVTVKKPMKLKRKTFAGKGYIEEEHIEFVEEDTYIPPNVTAQIFWLKNRRPERWRDKVQNEVINADVEDLSPLVELLRDE